MDELKKEGPAALVSVARAAHRTGDRNLERAARLLLLDDYGIRISFTRKTPAPAVKTEAAPR
jgi:hypothetical protein